jgi:hypothetical protein
VASIMRNGCFENKWRVDLPERTSSPTYMSCCLLVIYKGPEIFLRNVFRILFRKIVSINIDGLIRQYRECKNLTRTTITEGVGRYITEFCWN